MDLIKGKKDSSNDSADDSGRARLFPGSNHAIYGGIVAAAIALGAQWLLGSVYGRYEALQMLESMSSPALFFGSACVTAAATILALMLTILSLMTQADSEFDREFYSKIRRIGQLATVALVGGIVLLLFLSIPFQEAKDTPSWWFVVLYYVLMIFLATLAGLLMSIVLMLQNAISGLIGVIKPSDESDDEENSSNLT